MNKLDREQLKNFLFVSIISADNDEFDEDTKQAIIQRYDKSKKDQDWEYVLEPIKDASIRSSLIHIFNNETD